MSIHLQRQFDKLKKSVLTLGTMVEEAVGKSIRAIQQRDPQLASQVIAADEHIDLMEVDVEEECLHTLALHQPVAFDLRFVVAVLKINNDLERIADLAVNISQQAQFLAEEAELSDMPFDLAGMAKIARGMLKQSLDALVNIDPQLAQEVRSSDNRLDAMHREVYERVEQAIRENPHQLSQYIHMLNISRQLERIGDHCTNIAEDVVYMAKGDIARHNHIGSEV